MPKNQSSVLQIIKQRLSKLKKPYGGDSTIVCFPIFWTLKENVFHKVG